MAACLVGVAALLVLASANGAAVDSIPHRDHVTSPSSASTSQNATHRPIQHDGPAGPILISCLVAISVGRAPSASPGIYQGRLCLLTVAGAVLEVDSAECTPGLDGEMWSNVRVQVPPSGTLVLDDWAFASNCAPPFTELVNVWGTAPDGAALAGAARLCVMPPARGVSEDDGPTGC